MKTFICPLENFIKSEKTEITSDASTGTVAVAVKNTNGIVVDDFCIVGIEGDDQTEIAQVVSVVENETITFSNLRFAHKSGTLITKIRYNQRKLYGCATKTGTFVAIGSATGIEVDNPRGTYFEYTGTTYVYFKATYYNSETAEESDIDDAKAIQAGIANHYCSVYDIREEAGFLENPYISDGMINARRLVAENEIKASVGVIYSLPLSADCEIIKQIARLLSAGWLMYKEYGSEASGTAKDGMEKVKEARSMLKSIRERRLILLDEDDTELNKVTSPMTQVKGWPDSTTEDADEADSGGEIKFRIMKQF